MHRFIAALLVAASCASIAQAQSADPTSTSPPLTLEQALSLAGATAPSLEAATAGVRAAEAGRTVAGYRPNPSIVAETENIAGSGQYRGLRSAETTAGLALPIELDGKRSARIAVADAIGNRARLGTAPAEADLRLAITQLYIEATAAERRLVTAREQANVANAATTARNASGPALASAREAARIARIGYREGKFGQLDLLDAERTLSETRTAAIDALATYHDAKARLERLVAAAPSPEETNQ